VISISAGLLILALSSLSRNSRYVALFWIGMWFVTSSVAGVLYLVNMEQQAREQHRAVVAGEKIDFKAEKELAARRDWRPLVSYTQNLYRIGQELLGTDAAWEKLSRLHPEVLDFRGPQFPWYWSAAVLLGWLVLSICILNFRIKSLDQLR
jgi:ABC-2 type transport system permease protein